MILAAVDFSPPSAAALVWAAKTATAFDYRLTILHVVHDPEAAPGYYQTKKRKKYLTRLEEAAAEMFGDFLDEVMADNPGLPILAQAGRRLVVGLPVQRILEVAAEIDARAIVVGSNGRTGLSHLLLGSKAERVAQLSPVPVTIVKTPR